MRNADSITSSILTGANLNASTFFHLNANVSVNWISGEKSTVGGTRTLSGYLQPVFIWQRAGLQIAPAASYNQMRTELLGGIFTNNSAAAQYGGRLSWTMPGDLKISTLAFEGDFDQNRNLIAGTNQKDMVLGLIWTVVWGRQRNF